MLVNIEHLNIQAQVCNCRSLKQCNLNCTKVNTVAGTYIHSSSITPSDCYRLAELPEWKNGVETVVVSLLSFLKTH